MGEERYGWGCDARCWLWIEWAGIVGTAVLLDVSLGAHSYDLAGPCPRDTDLSLVFGFVDSIPL